MAFATNTSKAIQPKVVVWNSPTLCNRKLLSTALLKKGDGKGEAMFELQKMLKEVHVRPKDLALALDINLDDYIPVCKAKTIAEAKAQAKEAYDNPALYVAALKRWGELALTLEELSDLYKEVSTQEVKERLIAAVQREVAMVQTYEQAFEVLCKVWQKPGADIAIARCLELVKTSDNAKHLFRVAYQATLDGTFSKQVMTRAAELELELETKISSVALILDEKIRANDNFKDEWYYLERSAIEARLSKLLDLEIASATTFDQFACLTQYPSNKDQQILLIRGLVGTASSIKECKIAHQTIRKEFWLSLSDSDGVLTGSLLAKWLSFADTPSQLAELYDAGNMYNYQEICSEVLTKWTELVRKLILEAKNFEEGRSAYYAVKPPNSSDLHEASFRKWVELAQTSEECFKIVCAYHKRACEEKWKVDKVKETMILARWDEVVSPLVESASNPAEAMIAYESVSDGSSLKSLAFDRWLSLCSSFEDAKKCWDKTGRQKAFEKALVLASTKEEVRSLLKEYYYHDHNKPVLRKLATFYGWQPR